MISSQQFAFRVQVMPTISHLVKPAQCHSWKEMDDELPSEDYLFRISLRDKCHPWKDERYTTSQFATPR
jgi:hypothetical protein